LNRSAQQRTNVSPAQKWSWQIWRTAQCRILLTDASTGSSTSQMDTQQKGGCTVLIASFMSRCSEAHSGWMMK